MIHARRYQPQRWPCHARIFGGLMSEARTDAVKSAEQQVEDAISALNLALADENGKPPGVVMDYVLLYAVRKFDDEGDPLTSIAWQQSQSGWHVSLGLLEYARERFKVIVNSLEDEDD